MKKTLLILIVFSSQLIAYSQAFSEYEWMPVPKGDKAFNDNQLIAYWENDMFLRTDYYFTNGAAFELISPGLSVNSLNRFLTTPFILGNRTNSITLRQNMYTPENMYLADIQRNDRPYAGYMILDYKLSSESTRRKFTSSLTIGIIGRHSLAGETQNLVHSMDHLKAAEGWEYQVNNAPVINLNYSHAQKLVYTHFFDIQYGLDGRLGSLYTDASAHVGLRVGKLGSGFDYASIRAAAGEFNLYGFANIGARLSYYDATLQGSIMGLKPNQHFLNNNERHMMVSGLSFGMVASYRFIKVQASIVKRTPEYKGGKSHGWGQVSLGIRF